MCCGYDDDVQGMRLEKLVADSPEVMTSIGRISVLQCLSVERSGVGRGKHSQGLSVDGKNLLYQVSLSTGA